MTVMRGKDGGRRGGRGVGRPGGLTSLSVDGDHRVEGPQTVVFEATPSRGRE